VHDLFGSDCSVTEWNEVAMGSVVKPPPHEMQGRLYAVAMSFCLSVRLSVHLSPETRSQKRGFLTNYGFY